MFSGIWPRGRSSAPGSGKQGSPRGNPAGPGRPRSCPCRSPADRAGVRQTGSRRAFAGPRASSRPSGPRPRRIGRAACARRPRSNCGRGARFQGGGRRLPRAVPRALRREREIEARLVIERVGFDAPLQLAEVAERGRLLGKLDRGAGAGDRRVVRLGRRRHGEEALRAVEIAECRHEACTRAASAPTLFRVLRQDGGIELGGARRVARRPRARRPAP